MKKGIIAVLLIAFFAGSCTQNKSGNQSQTSDSSTVDEQKNIFTDGKSCYVGIVGRDTVFLELERTGNNFDGFLFYNRYQTDSSIGEYTGTISGDTLKGVFDFMSEGIISKIDKYFLLQNKKLVEAIGAFKEKDDYTLVFENPSELQYGESYILEATDCSPEFISEKDKEFYYNLKK